MADIKAGDLGFKPLDLQEQWDEKYEVLIRTKDVNELIGLLGNASSDEMEYYQKQALGILFCPTKSSIGIFEQIGRYFSTLFGMAAGAGSAVTLGATTTSWGLFGFTAFTTFTAAPVALVVAATAGGAALGYGTYTLISNSAKDRGKDEHFKKTKQEGRYSINPIRTLNPFMLCDNELSKYVGKIYETLMCLSPSKQDEEDFLKIFDANAVLNANLVQEGRKKKEEEFNKVAKAMRDELQSYLSEYYEKLKQRYKTTNKDIINRYIAFVEVNNEYITPRVDQAAKKELLDEVQKGNVGVTKGVLIFEEFRAVFSVYKMLLNHPQNTSKQIELQKEKMYERAEKLGATELFENILAEDRLVKLDKTNYIRYLQEIVSVLDSEDARAFINELTNDIVECMLVDSVMEPYEKEMIQKIANTFSNLLDTSDKESPLSKALAKA